MMQIKSMTQETPNPLVTMYLASVVAQALGGYPNKLASLDPQ